MAAQHQSTRITRTMAERIWWLKKQGNLFQHEIAALIGCNQGRISEVLTGKRFPEVKPQA